ncbi:MAG: hypothetical protein ABIO55_03830 [Ginsengibacter sp.]
MPDCVMPNINATTLNSYPFSNKYGYDQQSFAVLNGVSYFGADDGIHGRQIRRSDRTDAKGQEAWVSDATEAGAKYSCFMRTYCRGM